MTTWTIAPSGDHLLRDGEPDFLLCDTLWAALHRAEPVRFEQVLDLRRDQGFSAVMMSLLPLAHDRSGDIHQPFALRSDGSPDFSRLEPGWLERAESMLEAVVARGLTPMLMIQWVNYMPETWASLEAPELVMNDEDSLAMLRTAVERFARFDPIWSLSGDEVFTSARAIERTVLLGRTLRELDPHHLITAHTGGWVNLPEAVNEVIDFVGYQSGHDGANWSDNPQTWNRYLRSTLRTRRPAMNLEPPYEAHGYNNGEGRYLAREVRLASWRSVLTGGGAGLGYGAHGLWSWHRAGEAFSSEGWSGMPLEAMVAAELPGALDVAWLRRLVVRHELWRLDDRSDLVVRDRSGIRVGATKDLDLLAVHAPHSFAFEIQVDASDYDVVAHDLIGRREVAAERGAGESGKLVIGNPAELSEHLYILTRR